MFRQIDENVILNRRKLFQRLWNGFPWVSFTWIQQPWRIAPSDVSIAERHAGNCFAPLCVFEISQSLVSFFTMLSVLSIFTSEEIWYWACRFRISAVKTTFNLIYMTQCPHKLPSIPFQILSYYACLIDLCKTCIAYNDADLRCFQPSNKFTNLHAIYSCYSEFNSITYEFCQTIATFI